MENVKKQKIKLMLKTISQNRLTQTVIIELHDQLIEALENEDETALISLDQRKSYDVISHKFLIQKSK